MSQNQHHCPALNEDEIENRLKEELPHWVYENGWIRRKIKTSGWKATLMVVNTVGHLAEKAWHHPDLTVSYAFVIVNNEKKILICHCK
jgi:4a-hydroxytetrahydrobiopterin dehydratase